MCVVYVCMYMYVCVCDLGGTIAASWAVLRCMGQEGYLDVARKLMEVANIMKSGINGTKVCPCCCCVGAHHTSLPTPPPPF